MTIDGRAWHGITLTARSTDFTSGVPRGSAVLLAGANNTLRNVFFNGTYEASWGHSLGIGASSGTTRVEYTDFYQSVWEDQWVANGSGGTIVFDHCVFRDDNKPYRTDTDHRDVAHPWMGPGGWNLTVSNSLFFDTPERQGVEGPQGDELLIQNASKEFPPRSSWIALISDAASDRMRALESQPRS